MVLLLPATMVHLVLVAGSEPARLLALPPALPGLQALWSPSALLLCLSWLGLQAAFYLLPARKVCAGAGRWTEAGVCLQGRRRGEGRRLGPDTTPRGPHLRLLCPQVAEGLELKDKRRLRYPINGAWGEG